MGKNPSPLITADDKTTEVTLKIQGPKSLIPREYVITTSATITWKDLLNDELKLKIPLNEGIFICKPGKDPKTKSGSKWRTELNQEVRHYVNQYSRNLDYYVACIRRPDTVAAAPSKTTASKPKNLQKKSTPVPQENFLMAPPPTIPTPRAKRSTSRSVTRTSGESTDQNHENTCEKIAENGAKGKTDTNVGSGTVEQNRREMEKKDSSEMNGFDKGLVPEKIFGAWKEKDGEIKFLIKWRDETASPELVTNQVAKEKCPDLLFQFYEERCEWPKRVTDEESVEKGEGRKN